MGLLDTVVDVFKNPQIAWNAILSDPQKQKLIDQGNTFLTVNKKVVDPQPTVDWTKLIDALNTTLTAQSTSAIQAQNAEAAATRAFNASEAEKARSFSAAQAALDRDFQESSALRAQQFSADQAQLDRDWQERMSSTSYQRAVSDLRAAGLNPVLAAGNGGASTPGGSAASGINASGAMASAPAASGQQANIAAAKTADLKSLDLVKEIVFGVADVITDGISSAMKIANPVKWIARV